MKSEGFSHELQHKVSRTALKAAERGREELFTRLTAANAETIAAVMAEPPVMYERDADAPQELLLDPEIATLLPDAFFDDPTAWIESQPDFVRTHLPPVERVADYWTTRYDTTRIKDISLTTEERETKRIISKRIDTDQLSEVARAQQAHAAGIPTPQVLGEIIDKGNTYALFEYIPGRDVNDIIQSTIAEQRDNILRGIILYAVFTEKEFEEQMQLHLPDISDAEKQRYRSVWEKHLPHMIEHECLYTLKGFLIRSQVPSFDYTEKNHHTEIKEPREKVKRYDPDYTALNKVVRQVGYTDFEALYVENPCLASTILEKDSQVQCDTLIEKVDHQKLNTQKQFKESFINEMKTLGWQSIAGIDYLTERDKIKQLCVESDIDHKDFEPRNMIIPWDFEKNHALQREEGEPKLYVIDWEVEKNDSNPTDD